MYYHLVHKLNGVPIRESPPFRSFYSELKAAAEAEAEVVRTITRAIEIIEILVESTNDS